jgi:hypothetical protein
VGPNALSIGAHRDIQTSSSDADDALRPWAIRVDLRGGTPLSITACRVTKQAAPDIVLRTGEKVCLYKDPTFGHPGFEQHIDELSVAMETLEEDA